MRVVVFLNGASGSAVPAEDIRRAFSEAGVDTTIWALTCDEMKHAAHTAMLQGYDAIVAAGGDGTVSCVASAVEGKLPLGVLPLGTFNNFARDLGVPLDLEGAARVIAAGNVQRVDVGEVNGRFFLNNSSIGLYPALVAERGRHRWRRRAGKMLAMLRASRRVLARFPVLDVLVATADKHVARKTPFVFVGNNRYIAKPFSAPRRARLDGGLLFVSVGNRTGRWGILRLVVRTLTGRISQQKDVETVTLPEVWVDAGKRSLKVALDGEITRLSAPLHYKVRPLFLPVFVP